MKTTNHTPGPWYVTDIAIIGNDGGTWVAEHPAVKWKTLKSITKSGDAIVAESIKQANANAHLIAAAPKLLQVLKDLLPEFVDLYERFDPTGEIAVWDQWTQEALEVIAEAEGAK
jgi:thioester reductase-like protein